MGRIADQLTELIERMQESDRRLQRLLDEHVDATETFLDDLKKIDEED